MVKRAILALLVLAVVGFGVYAALEPVAVFGVSSTGLEGSINRELDSEALNPNELECRERDAAPRSGAQPWQCTGTRFGAETVSSRVLVDEDGCWRIVGGFGGEFGGRRACINLWDATGTPLF